MGSLRQLKQRPDCFGKIFTSNVGNRLCIECEHERVCSKLATEKLQRRIHQWEAKREEGIEIYKKLVKRETNGKP